MPSCIQRKIVPIAKQHIFRAHNEQVLVNHSPFFLPDAAKAILIVLRKLTLRAVTVLALAGGN